MGTPKLPTVRVEDERRALVPSLRRDVAFCIFSLDAFRRPAPWQAVVAAETRPSRMVWNEGLQTRAAAGSATGRRAARTSPPEFVSRAICADKFELKVVLRGHRPISTQDDSPCTSRCARPSEWRPLITNLKAP